MISKTYAIQETPYDHDTCHLFEHVILKGFRNYLEKLGINRAFFGWARGQTTNSSIFFSITAHNPEIIDMFEAYLNQPDDFDDETITKSLGNVEAESNYDIKINDTRTNPKADQ